METNPAFYHEPDDVKIEVNPVGSGPSQEHFTDQVTSFFKKFCLSGSKQISDQNLDCQVLKCAL